MQNSLRRRGETLFENLGPWSGCFKKGSDADSTLSGFIWSSAIFMLISANLLLLFLSQKTLAPRQLSCYFVFISEVPSNYFFFFRMMRFLREVEWNIWESFHTLLKGIFPAKITKEFYQICVVNNDAPCWSGLINRSKVLFENSSKNVLEISLKCPPELQISVTHVVTRSGFPAKVISLKESAARNLTARNIKDTRRQESTEKVRLINYFCSEAFSLLPI